MSLHLIFAGADEIPSATASFGV